MRTLESFKSVALAIFLLSSCLSTTDASLHKPTNAASTTFLKPSKNQHQIHDGLAKRKKQLHALNVQGGAEVSGGTATMSTEIFNLVKSIVGAGVLSLPAGIAAFGNAPSAVIPANILITVIGSISGEYQGVFQ